MWFMTTSSLTLFQRSQSVSLFDMLRLCPLAPHLFSLNLFFFLRMEVSSNQNIQLPFGYASANVTWIVSSFLLSSPSSGLVPMDLKVPPREGTWFPDKSLTPSLQLLRTSSGEKKGWVWGSFSSEYPESSSWQATYLHTRDLALHL